SKPKGKEFPVWQYLTASRPPLQGVAKRSIFCEGTRYNGRFDGTGRYSGMPAWRPRIGWNNQSQADILSMHHPRPAQACPRFRYGSHGGPARRLAKGQTEGEALPARPPRNTPPQGSPRSQGSLEGRRPRDEAPLAMRAMIRGVLRLKIVTYN